MKYLRILLAVAVLMALPLTAQYSSAAPNLEAFSGQLTGEAPTPSDPLTLWYRKPAVEWTSALPIGNGIQGAMIYGGIDNEIICLNEHTLWAGGPYIPDNPDALAALPQVRQMLFESKYREARDLISESMMASPLSQLPYQPVGDLMLSFPATDTAENYSRELNLSTATAKVQYTAGGTTFVRELIASYPDNVMVLRLTADKPGQINFKLSMRTQQNLADTDNSGTDDTLILTGTNLSANGIDGALRFQTRVKIINSGGTLTKALNSAEQSDGETLSPYEYSVSGADDVEIIITTATSFKKYDDVTGDPVKITSDLIEKASAKGYEAIRRDQLADHKEIFDRVALDLGANEDAKLPTDERILSFAESNDPALVTLYFQYGRYLLISSSRPGGQPANLQGIWNADTRPSWDSKYTININAEMNYWPVNNTNLGECLEPLMKMVEDLQITGARTAKTMYNARGWVAHHNTDLWRATAPIDGPDWGMWPMGGAWLCTTLWDNYEYTQDRAFLERLYPVMKGSAVFFLDTLVEEPGNKWLITSPSLSPEVPHPYGASVVAGPTCDVQLLRDLFAHCIEASKILGIDEDLRTQIAETRKRLAPNQIGEGGQLQEWLEDWDMISMNKNRHVSHLYGLFPGKDISYYNDKELTAAVRKSLELRGDNATGWGLGWRLNLWARLHDAPHSYIIIGNLLAPARPEGVRRDRAGVYNNLFDAHPPFQIDGNFGGTAGIAEMLVQSLPPRDNQPARIELLPALVTHWPNGKVAGLMTRGNFSVDIVWEDGTLAEATIRNLSSSSKTVNVSLGEKTVPIKLNAGASQKLDGQLVTR
ncbi:glycoside hydrolase N-terminal domain-containing protein [Candidatus Latescibacterota bacterium]